MSTTETTTTAETTAATTLPALSGSTDPTRPVSTSHGLALVTTLDAHLGRELTGTFTSIQLAEDEIAAARTRHPRHADTLFHSFRLLHPTSERMETEFVYRSHCRELLDRVATGADTRPGTAAEVCCAMLKTALNVPLRSSGFGLYTRMWEAAGFPSFPEMAELRVHHEALESSVIDDHERDVRRRLAVADRRIREVDCRGRHHGVEVRCAYARTGQVRDQTAPAEGHRTASPR